MGAVPYDWKYGLFSHTLIHTHAHSFIRTHTHSFMHTPTHLFMHTHHIYVRIWLTSLFREFRQFRFVDIKRYAEECAKEVFSPPPCYLKFLMSVLGADVWLISSVSHAHARGHFPSLSLSIFSFISLFIKKNFFLFFLSPPVGARSPFHLKHNLRNRQPFCLWRPFTRFREKCEKESDTELVWEMERGGVATENDLLY